jgi:hypothetical protein
MKDRESLTEHINLAELDLRCHTRGLSRSQGTCGNPSGYTFTSTKAMADLERFVRPALSRVLRFAMLAAAALGPRQDCAKEQLEGPSTVVCRGSFALGPTLAGKEKQKSKKKVRC